MRITPLDVRKQEFNKSMRGFDCDEVRAFLTTLADEYETVLVDNKQIREQIMAQDDKITEYQTMERTLRDTLMTAERVMQETRENAGREGGLIIQEAQMKAKGILEECRIRTEELRREIVGLRKEKETYLARFRGLAEAQISFIDTHESDFEDLDRRLVDIVDNVVTVAHTSEVTATVEPVAAPAPRPIPAVDMAVPEASPEVAPRSVAAPVVGEKDIWRDYDPGNTADAPASDVAAVAADEQDAVGSIADIVSESLNETETAKDEIAVTVEALTIGEPAPGPGEPEVATVTKDDHATEPVNI